jgi:hypothetical protein
VLAISAGIHWDMDGGPIFESAYCFNLEVIYDDRLGRY